MFILIVGALLCKECDAEVDNLLGSLGGGPLTLHCGILGDKSDVRDVVAAHTPTNMRFRSFEGETSVTVANKDETIEYTTTKKTCSSGTSK